MSEQRPRDEHDEAVDTVAYALGYDLPATRLLPFHRLTATSSISGTGGWSSAAGSWYTPAR